MKNNTNIKWKKGTAMEVLIPVVVLVTWIVLQAWVLPRFGVKT
jgi:hypothetical protein